MGSGRTLVLGVLLWAACGSSSDQHQEPGADAPSVESDKLERRLVLDMISASTREVDLLFVIDSSSSMREEQEDLARWSEDALFGLLRDEGLETFDLHVGLVSMNLGAGAHDVQSCDAEGDDGRLLTSPTIEGCSAPAGAYLVNERGSEGGRVANHDGTLAEAFGCIAQIGVSGCGIEQPLEAMRRALDGRHAEHEGFLRSDSILAVVFVTDEDDCSVFDTDLFDPDPLLEEELGPLTSFRCFEHGVQCRDDDPRRWGVKAECSPRADSQFIQPIEAYTHFLKELKGDTGRVVVGAIAGRTDYVAVKRLGGDNPWLESSCRSQDPNEAQPPIRLQAFLDQFPARSSLGDICSGVNHAPVTRVASQVADAANRSSCIPVSILDIDADEPGLQADCQLWGRWDDQSVAVPSCQDSAGAEPCFDILRDETACQGRYQERALKTRGVPEGGRLQLWCR